MKRYFYYLVFINSFNNIIIFLPNVIFRDQCQGSIMAIIFAIPYGTFLLYIFMRFLIKFPNKTFPQILKVTMPPWAQISIMLFLCTPWYISGFMMLIALIQMIERFIFINMPEFMLLILVVLIILFTIISEGSAILYSLEIFIVIIASMLGFIFIKAILNPYFSWDSCIEVATHSFTRPKLTSFAATTYMFSGYIDMVIFNKFFNKENFQLTHIWLFSISELIFLIFAFFIPIGFLGTKGVAFFNYPWIATTDCISIKTGLVERTMFVYLLVFFLTAILNIIVHWHVALELIKELFQCQFNLNVTKKITYCILLILGILPFLLIRLLPNEDTIFSIGIDWLTLRLFLEPIVVGFVFLTAYIGKRKGLV